MRKRLVSMIMAGTLAMSMALTGCTSGGGTTTTPDTGSTGDTGETTEVADTGDTGETADTPVEASGELIKVGVVNNPPSESGYRQANVEDMEKVFSEENGYELKTYYSIKNDEQLQAAQGFITDGVDYL
nr:sugar ABC transporter substrate-binding protein [Lachnospiraceae bacterium]